MRLVIIHDVLNFHAAELTEKDLEKLTTLNEPDYDSVTIMDRPQLNK